MWPQSGGTSPPWEYAQTPSAHHHNTLTSQHPPPALVPRHHNSELWPAPEVACV